MTEGPDQRPPTVTGFAVNSALSALRKRNVDPHPLLDQAGLIDVNFDDPKVRVPASSEGDFLEYAAEAIDDTAFGLHLAEHVNPRQAGLLFYAASAANTLGETLALVVKYFALVNESLRLNGVKESEGTVVKFDLVGVYPQRVKHNTEFWIGTMVKAAREITTRDFEPIQISFPHVRSTVIHEFERVFRSPVDFGAPSGLLALSRDTLALPLITADAYLLKTLLPFCEERASGLRTPIGSLRYAVENELQRLLPQGRANAAACAKALALSERSLSRKLSAEGKTFGEILDYLRHNLALQYLKTPDYTSAQIARLLGYESSASFNHAFNRWTGQSPSAARTNYARASSVPMDISTRS